MTKPAAFERERRALVERFELYADRKAKPFVMLSSGLSHGSGHIQHILSPEQARELGVALIEMAVFASKPLPGQS